MTRALSWWWCVAVLAACGASRPAVIMPAERVTTAPPVAAPDGLDLRLGAVSEQLGAAGFASGDFRARGFLPAGDRRAERVVLPASSCVALVAVASAGMVDLDAGIYLPDGTALAEDDNADAHPALTLCTGAASLTVYYTLHAYRGAGAFVVSSFVRSSRAEDVLAAPAADDTPRLAQELRSSLSKRGFEDEQPPLTLDIPAREQLRVAVALEAGRCYTFAAQAEDVAPELRLVDADDQEWGHGAPDGSLSALQTCAAETRELSLLLVARGASNRVVLFRFTGREERVGGAAGLWLREPGPSAAVWASARDAGPQRGGPSQNAVSIARDGQLAAGQVMEWAAPRLASECTLFRVSLGKGLAAASLRVSARSGAPLAGEEGQAPGFVVKTCGPRPAHVALVARAGAGSFSLSAEPVPRHAGPPP